MRKILTLSYVPDVKDKQNKTKQQQQKKQDTKLGTE